jgi:signal peptide peptidase SppA
MWRAAMRAREKKPIVVSMGDVCASGGYYLASAGDVVFAEPDTITGSIGVFGLMFNAEELASKVGINRVELSRGARPGPTIFRGITDDERARLQQQVDGTYEQFLNAIVEGRGTERLTLEKAREVGEGRVWTGAQAKERGLVDAFGGILDAIDAAVGRAALDPADGMSLRVMVPDAGFSGFPMLRAASQLQALSALTGQSDVAAMKALMARFFVDPDALGVVLASEGKPVLRPAMTVRIR